MTKLRGPGALAFALMLGCTVACGGTETTRSANDGAAGNSNNQGSGGSSSTSAGGATASAGTSSSAESGGRTTSSAGTAGGGDVCTGELAHCRPLCEAGSCQCDCGTSEGCGSPGWVETTLPWTAFNLSGQAGAGVTLCHPAEFAFREPPPAANSPELLSKAILRFLAYARVDHANAVRYLEDQDKAYCDYDPAKDYAVKFLQVGGWPAVEQTYTEPAAICGACTSPVKPALLWHVNFYLAAGSNVIVAQAAADPANVADLEDVFSIVETIRVDNGEAPTSTSDALVALNQSHQASCHD
ncbi:MAG TPA: hypothetical protein VIW29_03515 [Polyangiaceae bacterium]